MQHNVSGKSKLRRRIIEEVASLPVEQLRAELSEVQAGLAETKSFVEEFNRRLRILEAEEQVLAQMLRFHQWQEDGVPGTAGTIQALRDGASEAVEQTVSANVLAIVKQASAPVTPAEVQQRLALAGVEADASSIRGALRRWVQRDMLVKNGSGYERAPKVT